MIFGISSIGSILFEHIFSCIGFLMVMSSCRYFRAALLKHLNVSSPILQVILCCMGSQCKHFSASVELEYFGPPLQVWHKCSLLFGIFWWFCMAAHRVEHYCSPIVRCRTLVHMWCRLLWWPTCLLILYWWSWALPFVPLGIHVIQSWGCFLELLPGVWLFCSVLWDLALPCVVHVLLYWVDVLIQIICTLSYLSLV